MHPAGLTKPLTAQIALKLLDAEVSDFEVSLVRRDLGEVLAALLTLLGSPFRPDSIVDAVNMFLKREDIKKYFFQIFNLCCCDNLKSLFWITPLTRRMFLELNFMSHIWQSYGVSFRWTRLLWIVNSPPPAKKEWKKICKNL